jgi:hypothetical protein
VSLHQPFQRIQQIEAFHYIFPSRLHWKSDISLRESRRITVFGVIAGGNRVGGWVQSSSSTPTDRDCKLKTLSTA